MSQDTPRTENARIDNADFARELERKNAALRGRMARLCRAVSARIQADEPTPEERLELMESYDSACALLADTEATDAAKDSRPSDISGADS